MDCLEAQRLVSEQLDREPVDAEQMEIAKEHCRSCPECAAYVRTLVAVRKASLPEPPAGLAERVMDAVGAQMAMDTGSQASTLAETAPPRPAEPERAPSTTDLDDIQIDRLVSAVRERRNRRAVLAWAAAIALVFVVSGVGAIVGVRAIFTPPQATRSASLDEEAATMYAAPEAEDAATAIAPEAAKGAADATQNYITVGETVYRETGEAAGVDEATLKVVGSTSSTLGGSTVTTRDVLGGSDPSIVYVANDEGTLMAFEHVLRTFRSADYALTSRQLTRYGEWPMLPAGLPNPSNANGSPEYVSAGTDSEGVTVYRQADGDASTGIAVPPGTQAADPAAGNPNWTWWRPLQ